MKQSLKRALITAAAVPIWIGMGLFAVPTVSGQFIDRIVRPCPSGTARASVIANPLGTGNVDVTPCVGGTLTVDGVVVPTIATGVQVFNVKAYGAVCDGVTVDTVAIAAANTAAVAAGGSVYIPPSTTGCKVGTTTITAPIQSDGGSLLLTTGLTTTITNSLAIPPQIFFRNATAGLGTVSLAGNTSLKEVYLQWWGNNTTPGTTDMTAPFQAAVVAFPFGVFFPDGTYLFTDTITSAVDNTNIYGAGFNATTLRFNPASEKPAIVFSAGASVISFCSIKDLTLSSINTVKKQGIRISDATEVFLENVKINGFNSTGKDSIGLQLRGRQLQTFKNLTITADIPISIEDNPNSTIDIDHYRFENLYLIADVTQPCILIASGANLSNVSFDGYQSWVQGKYGLYWNDTTSAAISFALKIKNARWEQNTDNTGYQIYVAHNTNLNGLVLENLYGGGVSGNGLFFRKVNFATIINNQYQGSLVGLDANSTDTNFTFINPAWPTATFTLTGFIYYNATSVPGNNFRNVTIANNANAALLPATGSGAMTRGMVLVIAGGGASALFQVAGSNNAVTQLTVSASFSITPANAGTTNVYWSAGNARYEIENKLGIGFTYSVYAWLDTVN